MVLAPADELLSPSDLAAELQVPVSTIYRWRQRRTGPRAVRIGRHLRFRRSDVNLWLEARADAPKDAP